MAATRTCRKCGKERDLVAFSAPHAACDICRLTALLASSPSSTVYKSQLKRACERAGESYADACIEAMDRCSHTPQHLRNKTARAREAAAKRREQRNIDKQLNAAKGDLQQQVDMLTSEVERLVTKLADARNEAAHSRKLALENKELRAMNARLRRDIEHERQAVTTAQKTALKLAQKNRALAGRTTP